MSSKRGLTTPPPPSTDLFAALTMDVTERVVMEACMMDTLELRVEDWGK